MESTRDKLCGCRVVVRHECHATIQKGEDQLFIIATMARDRAGTGHIVFNGVILGVTDKSIYRNINVYRMLRYEFDRAYPTNRQSQAVQQHPKNRRNCRFFIAFCVRHDLSLS